MHISALLFSFNLAKMQHTYLYSRLFLNSKTKTQRTNPVDAENQDGELSIKPAKNAFPICISILMSFKTTWYPSICFEPPFTLYTSISCSKPSLCYSPVHFKWCLSGNNCFFWKIFRNKDKPFLTQLQKKLNQ